jgi:hypothetical protein
VIWRGGDDQALFSEEGKWWNRLVELKAAAQAWRYCSNDKTYYNGVGVTCNIDGVSIPSRCSW